MGVLGLLMRLTQATVIGLSPAWFYRLMTLHGSRHDRRRAARDDGRALVRAACHRAAAARDGCSSSYALTVRRAGACWSRRSSAASALAGRSCRRFRSTRPGSGRSGRKACSSSGNLLVGAGFCVYCFDVLEQTTTTYGGLARTLGWQFLRGREEEAPPPQAIAATVVAIDGLISCAVGIDDPARPARAHLRHERRLRRPRREEPRLLLRALDREPDRSTSALPRSTCSCPATPAAPTRRPRCSSPAGWARSSSSPPPTRTTCTWTSCSRPGRTSSPRSPPTAR